MARKRRGGTRGLGRRAAAGRGQYCVMKRAGKGKSKRTRTVCYKSWQAAFNAADKAAQGGKRFESVMFYKRKRS